MSRQRSNVIGRIILCACELLVGILLLINPEKFTTNIIRVAGICLLVAGVFSVIDYFRKAPEEALLEQGLVKGLCEVLFGLFCVFRTQWFLVTFPILTVGYGIAILVTGLVRVQWTFDMLRMKVDKWYIAAFGALLAVIFALIILLNPFKTTVFLGKFIGVSLIVEAAADVAILILSR